MLRSTEESVERLKCRAPRSDRSVQHAVARLGDQVMRYRKAMTTLNAAISTEPTTRRQMLTPRRLRIRRLKRRPCCRLEARHFSARASVAASASAPRALRSSCLLTEFVHRWTIRKARSDTFVGWRVLRMTVSPSSTARPYAANRSDQDSTYPGSSAPTWSTSGRTKTSLTLKASRGTAGNQACDAPGASPCL